MIPELERWKRFPPPWRTLGPVMAAEVRAAACGEPEPVTAARAPKAIRPARAPGKYKRRPKANGFSRIALRQRREAAGYSQSGLAYLIGSSQTRVSAWELGTSSPSPDRLVALAQALKCQAADLCVENPDALTLLSESASASAP